MKRILVVEDDKELNASVCDYLELNNYKAYACFDGQEALNLLQTESFDIIVSDIMMPVMNGFTMIEIIRNSNNQIPIIFMTAKDDKFSKQLAYKLGIDDYITKPFDIDELVLKIGAILRRVSVNQNVKLTIGNFTMDKAEHMAYIDGEEVNFSVREFDIIYKLLSYPKKTFTRSQLMEEFWDYDSSATSRTVDVYMAKLRDKTSKCNGFKIVTVHGLGYKVVLNEE